MSELSALKIDRTPRRRKARSRPWLGRVIALLIVGGLLWLFWSPVGAWIDSVRLPEVQVLRVSRSDAASVGAARGAAANGYITAARRAALSADTPGRIVEMLVTEGSVVRAGDVVARLYSDDYRAAVERARAEHRSALAAVKSAEARERSETAKLESARRTQDANEALVDDAKAALKLANTQLERERELLDGGISSPGTIDARLESQERAMAQLRAARARLQSAVAGVSDAEHQLEIATADLAVANASVAVAQASLDQADATFAKTEVRAPFDGIVVLKDAEVGEVVSPNSQGGSNARGSVCTLVDFDSLEAQADVAEMNLERVAVGARVNVYVDAFVGREYPGRVDRIWPTADRTKSTVEVRVKFDKLDRDLRPDMGVRIVFLSDAEPTERTDTASQILIPRDAVVTQGGTPVVFVVERGVVIQTTVELGAVSGRRVIIESGLEPGQNIVLAPPTSLADGDRVRVAQS